MDFGRQHLGTTLCFKIILTIVCIFISFYNKASSDKVGNFFFLSWNWHRYLQNKKDKEKMKVSILLDFKSLINYKSSYKPVNRKITVTYGWGEITKTWSQNQSILKLWFRWISLVFIILLITEPIPTQT